MSAVHCAATASVERFGANLLAEAVLLTGFTCMSTARLVLKLGLCRVDEDVREGDEGLGF